jgi:hypothetical protein
VFSGENTWWIDFFCLKLNEKKPIREIAPAPGFSLTRVLPHFIVAGGAPE